MPKFKMATLLWLFVVLAVSLGWFADHVRLTPRPAKHTALFSNFSIWHELKETASSDFAIQRVGSEQLVPPGKKVTLEIFDCVNPAKPVSADETQELRSRLIEKIEAVLIEDEVTIIHSGWEQNQVWECQYQSPEIVGSVVVHWCIDNRGHLLISTIRQEDRP